MKKMNFSMQVEENYVRRHFCSVFSNFLEETWKVRWNKTCEKYFSVWKLKGINFFRLNKKSTKHSSNIHVRRDAERFCFCFVRSESSFQKKIPAPADGGTAK